MFNSAFVTLVKLNARVDVVAAINDKWSVLKVHNKSEFRVQLQSGVTLVQVDQLSDLYSSNVVQEEDHGTANQTLKNPQLEIREAHSAHTLIVSKTSIQDQISLQVAASASVLSTKVGGNRIQFHTADPLTVIFVHEIVKDHVIKLESLGSDKIFNITPLKSKVHQGEIFQVNVAAHVLVTVQERVIGNHTVVKVQVLLEIFQKSSVKLIKKL